MVLDEITKTIAEFQRTLNAAIDLAKKLTEENHRLSEENARLRESLESGQPSSESG